MRTHSHDTRPVLWGISGFLLGDSIEVVAAEFSDRARIDIVRGHSEEAVARIKQRLRHEHCDVFISSGGNASYVKARVTEVPMITVRISSTDFMSALIKARQVTGRIGVVLHKSHIGKLKEFASCFSLPVEFIPYETIIEAKNAISVLAERGVRAVVGGGQAVEMAHDAGMAGFFIHSLESIRMAIEDALTMVRVKQTERSRHEILTAVLRHLNDGVLAVDAEGFLIAANPAAEALLKHPLSNSIGKPLHSVLPSLTLGDYLVADEPATGSVEGVGGQALVVDRAPLFDADRRIGTVLTLHSPSYVEQAFSKLRAHSHKQSRAARYKLSDIIAESPSMRAVVRRCAVFAESSDAAILLAGPSGVGKELLAQGIHNASKRYCHPFMAVNCGAFPESLLESELFGYEEGAFTGARRNGKPGLFEVGDRGTIFFDEIAELPLLLQTRLLRVLQEKEVIRVGGHDAAPVNVRIIAATNKDLLGLIRQGEFREDLYYRICALRVNIPPLCERAEDLDTLAEHLLAASLGRVGLSRLAPYVVAVAKPLFKQHSWPGNVRELENAAERIAMACLESQGVLSEWQITRLLDMQEDIDSSVPAPPELHVRRREQEKSHIRTVLEECGWNREAAARRLGISRTTLWRKLNA